VVIDEDVVTKSYDVLSTKMRFTHYKIVEFSNLNSCAEMLSADVLSGVFMPVRFIAYQGVDDQKAYVSFLRPTRFAALFSATGVMDVAVGLEKDMSDVLEELA
jgi:uncharacterized protein (DUF302 family)